MPDQKFDFDKKLIRIPSYPDESAADYIIRLFEVRGMPWRPSKIQWFGTQLFDLLNGKYTDILRALSDQDPSSFIATTPISRSTKVVEIAGREIHRFEFTTFQRRWCPACFREDLDNTDLKARTPQWRVHRRWWWNMTSIRSCPIHHARLERVCPECGVNLEWGAGTLTTCRNGHSFLECRLVEVSAEDVVADEWLLARLQNRERKPVPLLDEISYSDAVRMLEVVGQAAIYGPKSSISNTPEDERGAVLSAGFRVLSGYPVTFDALLDELSKRSTANGTRSDMEPTYGNLVATALRYKKISSWKQLLDRIYRHHANEAAVFGYVRGKRGAAKFCPPDAPLTVADACKHFGKASPTMKRYLNAVGAMDGRKNTLQRIVVTREHIGTLETLFASAIDIDGLTKILNVPRTTVVRMIWDQCLPENPIFKQVRADKYRFTKPEIEAWLAGLTEGLPVVDECPPDLLSITNGNKANFGGLLGALRLIREGKVEPSAKSSSEKGLDAVLIDTKRFEKAHLGVHVEMMDSHEIAAYLDVQREMVGLLMEYGVIEKHGANEHRLFSTKQSVKEFREKTISSAEIAAELDTKPQCLYPFLPNLGIMPVLPAEAYKRQKGKHYWRKDIPDDIGTMFKNRKRRKKH